MIKSVSTELLIVTLGSEPQAITIALDYLLNSGHNFERIVVVFTVAPVVLEAAAVFLSEDRGMRKKAGKVVHLCISGGRKVMGIVAMVAAQLLFGSQDRVWYLITEGWKPGDG